MNGIAEEKTALIRRIRGNRVAIRQTATALRSDFRGVRGVWQLLRVAGPLAPSLVGGGKRSGAGRLAGGSPWIAALEIGIEIGRWWKERRARRHSGR